MSLQDGLTGILEMARASAELGDRVTMLENLAYANNLSYEAELNIDISEVIAIELICQGKMRSAVSQRFDTARDAARDENISTIISSLSLAREDAAYGGFSIPLEEEQEIWDNYFATCPNLYGINSLLTKAYHAAMFEGDPVKTDVCLTAAKIYAIEDPSLIESKLNYAWDLYMISGDPEERISELERTNDFLFTYDGPTDIGELEIDHLERLRDLSGKAADTPERFSAIGDLTTECKERWRDAHENYAEILDLLEDMDEPGEFTSPFFRTQDVGTYVFVLN